MKYVHEYRDADAAKRLSDAIHAAARRPWQIMEVCGGQTHAIVRYGIDQLLPDELTLIHGPGCPVCVTPLDMIDRPITFILFVLILLVLALHVRTLFKEYRAHQPEEDHDLHDSQTR